MSKTDLSGIISSGNTHYDTQNDNLNDNPVLGIIITSYIRELSYIPVIGSSFKKVIM